MNNIPKPGLEICIDSVASAIAAQAAGANRVELCDNLAEGGTTPSLGMLHVIRKMLNIDLFVLIRPRGGDFVYSNAEFEVMKEDIRLAKAAGADGIVTGILTPDGSVDVVRTEILFHLARPMQCTFHRAFDVTNDPLKAMEDIIFIGCDRVLSSGQNKSALGGAGLLRQMIQKAGDAIMIMPGGGITERNIHELAALTGATEFHMSLRSPVPSISQQKVHAVSLSVQGISESHRMVADETRIREVKKILQNI